MSSDESVLVYPASSFDSGVTAENVIEKMTYLRGSRYMPRSQAETDLDYVQVIPYIMVYQGGYLMFRRSSKSGEKRLSGCVTLGVGGHINWSDCLDTATGLPDGCQRHAYYRGACRELREELGAAVGNFATYEDTSWMRCVGLIRLRDTPVNSVHVGFVHRLELPADLPIVCDDSLSLYSMDQYLAERKRGEVTDLNLESWSRFLLSSGILECPALFSHGEDT